MHTINTPKKKILFVITLSELGGAQRWIYDTATHLDPARYEPVVASGEINASQELIRMLKEKGVATRPLRHLVRALNPFKDVLACLELYRLIRKEKPDILQLVSTKSGVLGSIAGKLAGAPVIIYRIGGWTFNDPRPQWQNTLFSYAEKITAPLKDRIIVNSHKGYDEALRHHICSQEKLILIYNGIDIAPYAHKIQKFKSSKLVIGTIANFYATKGLIYLLEAARMLKNRPLLFRIIGDGPERAMLESYILREKLTNIELTGAVPNTTTYLQEFDILIIPSVKEGLPYALLEAMAAGLPIIATTVGGIPEIIRDGENGILIPPRDPKRLVQQLIALEYDPHLRLRLAHNAQKTMRQYSIPKMMAQIHRLYQSF